MTKEKTIAQNYETADDEIVMNYFNEKGYTITRRDEYDSVDYNVTHDGKDILLEVKTRNCSSTDYDTAWIRQDKVEAMDRISMTEGKPAYLMYVYLGDRRFFISNVEELKSYTTIEAQVSNPIKNSRQEINVEIPLDEKKFYKIDTFSKN